MLKTIRLKDNDAIVKVAKDLIGYICTGDDSDYLFDSGFKDSVSDWQKEHGLDPDGVIGPKTWRKIAEAMPICSTSKNRESRYTQAIQILLAGNLTPDSIFGPRTKAAVVAFQASKGLETDGICGPKTWKALITGEVDDKSQSSGTFIKPIDFKQGDSRWGKKMYSNHGDSGQTMANSGCGPTAMADIVATVKDSSANPYTLAELSMDWGTRTYSSGTAWAFYPKVEKHYQFSKMIQTASLETMKACLDAGGYVVCSMGPGYWTKGGHFICAWKYDEDRIYCNDPASSKRVSQKTSEFMKERKQFFCFYN